MPLKKIGFLVGGTGGHLFPAERLASDLKDVYDFFFMGVNLHQNRYFSKSFRYYSIEGGPIKALFKILKGCFQSMRIFQREKPDILIGFGSYFSFPALLSAIFLRIPFILFEADSYPGKVNRIFSKRALFTAVQFPFSKQFLKGKVHQVAFLSGNIRNKNPTSKREARQFFGLDEERLTILIFGGSQGARSINEKMLEAFKTFHTSEAFQIIHLIGYHTPIEYVKEIYKDLKIPHYTAMFEKAMDRAWAASDLAICRSGASTLAEQIFFEVPSIYIPFPHAKSNHQLFNALFAMQSIGGAYLIPEEKASSDVLCLLLNRALKELSQKKDAIRLYKKNCIQEELAEVIKKNL